MSSPHLFARPTLFAGAVALALIAGCHGGSRSSVSGKVSYAGETVDDGGIAFVPAEGSSGLRATGLIHAGKYKLDSNRGPEPGKYRVEVTWRKKTGRKVPGEGGYPHDEVEPGIPPRYNTESELLVDVKPGHNTFDFILKE